MRNWIGQQLNLQRGSCPSLSWPTEYSFYCVHVCMCECAFKWLTCLLLSSAAFLSASACSARSNAFSLSNFSISIFFLTASIFAVRGCLQTEEGQRQISTGKRTWKPDKLEDKPNTKDNSGSFIWQTLRPSHYKAHPLSHRAIMRDNCRKSTVVPLCARGQSEHFINFGF